MRVWPELLSRSALLFLTVIVSRGQLPAFEAPPSAMTRSVEVSDGGRTEIRLGTSGSPGGKTLDIQIRLRPSKGRLDPVQVSIAGDGGTVAYTHNSSLGAGYDTFTYTVQRAGGPVSPPATVSVRIVESPSFLVVAMTQLDFGAVNPGDVGARQSLVLVNLGGGVCEGWVAPPRPWRVEGSQSYRLRRGERQSFALVFQPSAAGTFSSELRFGTEANQAVRLSGIGLAPAPSGPPGNPAVPPVNSEPENVQTQPTPTPADAMPLAEEAGAEGWPGGPANSAEWFPREPGGESPIVQVVALAATGENVLLRWPATTPGPGAYRVEKRRTVATARRLEVSWMPVPACFESQPADGSILARICSLQGGRTHCLRVVALNDAGQVRGYSAGIDVAVRAAPFGWMKWLTTLGLFGVAVIAAVAPRRR